jgi:hypothetical protein
LPALSMNVRVNTLEPFALNRVSLEQRKQDNQLGQTLTFQTSLTLSKPAKNASMLDNAIDVILSDKAGRSVSVEKDSLRLSALPTIGENP